MAYADTLAAARPFGQTARRDAWWVQPLLVFLGFRRSSSIPPGRRFKGNVITGSTATARIILSPFYSPEIFGSSPHAILGTARPGGRRGCCFPRRFLILWVPAGFRFTCYYYRGAYYKAFWADPPNCAVGEPRKVLSRRTLLPAHHAEHSPLLHVSGRAFHFHPRVRRLARRCGSRTRGHETFWHRRRNVGLAL